MALGVSIQNIEKYFGDFKALDGVSFDIEPGHFVTLLGPSGCGKTTLLRTIAGFLEPDGGEILFDGKVMNDVPPNKRNTAMCFQSYALFPHKTVYENVRFGLRMRKAPKEEHEERVMEALNMVNMGHLGQRKPYELSGGQQQRVALARAIVVRPDLLLFDEPLSNLDAKLREKVRVEIREVQQRIGITAIYVTHDQAEALAISDKIVSMSNGHIEQLAGPRIVYDTPKTRFVADFIGAANILPGDMVGEEGGFIRVRTPVGDYLSPTKLAGEGKDVAVCLRPEDFTIVPTIEGADNVFTGTVQNAVYMGNALDLFVKQGDHIVRASVDKEYIVQEGSTVSLKIAPERVHTVES